MLEMLPMWSNVQPQLQPHPCRMKYRNSGTTWKGVAGPLTVSPNLVDQCKRSVTEESRSLAKVNDSVGFESHQPCASCVSSHWIVCKHNLSQRTRAAVKGAVAFHGHNAVCDNEVDRNCGAYIKDALLNAFPMEDVLRPSVSRPRHNAKHVLHTKSDPRPVMGLDLRHGNQEIRFQHRAREPKVLHSGVAGSYYRLAGPIRRSQANYRGTRRSLDLGPFDSRPSARQGSCRARFSTRLRAKLIRFAPASSSTKRVIISRQLTARP
jgi:hypothetical protein